MQYRTSQTLKAYTVDLSPARAAIPMADALCDEGWTVSEVRIYPRMDQAKIIIQSLTAPGHAEEVRRAIDRTVTHTAHRFVLDAASGQGPLRLKE